MVLLTAQLEAVTLTFDPSLILSRARLRAGVNLFKTIKETGSPVNVVLPTTLMKCLTEISEGESPSHEFIDLLKKWSPSINLTKFFSYLQELKGIASDFLKTCEPMPASKKVEGVDFIGEHTVSRRSLSDKVGGVLGDVLFELLATAHFLKARILTFGDRLATLLHKAKFIVISLHHELKDELKKRSHTRTALKIGVWVFSVGTATILVDLIPGIPSPELNLILRALVSFGIKLAADKVQDAMERGVILFLNGTAGFYPTK